MVEPEYSERPDEATAEFVMLCDRLQLGAGSDEDARRLELLLHEHSHLLDFYVDRVYHHAALRLSAGPSIQLGGAAPIATSQGKAVADELLAADMPEICLGGMQQLDTILASPNRKPLELSSSVVGWVAAAMIAAIGIGSYFLSIVGNSSDEILAQNSTVDIGAVDLAEGSVKLRLPQVGYLVAEGESRFTLVSPMRLELEKGRIRVRVTEESGHGFVVATRHGEITDLGTEFGVDASSVDSSDLVVFDGAVDLRVAGEGTSPQRLLGGEGARFGHDGELGRIMSIATGTSSTFIDIERAIGSSVMAENDHVILDVRDNIRPKDTKSFYEVVYQGFSNHVKAYVDRPYLWGLREPSRIPTQLQGADYVKTFNNDKVLDIRIDVKLAAPSDLYLIWDDRVPPPTWLVKQFYDSGMKIERFELGVKDMGNEESRDLYRPCTLWHRHIDAPGWYALGSIEMVEANTGMYGIIAKRAITNTKESQGKAKTQASPNEAISKFHI